MLSLKLPSDWVVTENEPATVFLSTADPIIVSELASGPVVWYR